MKIKGSIAAKLNDYATFPYLIIFKASHVSKDNKPDHNSVSTMKKYVHDLSA